MVATESPLEKRQRYLRRLAELKVAQSSWRPHWMDLSDYIAPRRAQFLLSEADRGSTKNENIINSTATWGVRTLAAGMASGITSPARPWFRLTTANPDLAELASVKEWLYVVEDRIRWAFARSNIYKSFPAVYYDLGYIGTAPMLLEDDPLRTIRTYTFPVGSYYIANDDRGKVDTFYREFHYTTAQLVRKYGAEACSDVVQRAAREGRVDERHAVLHAIQPNNYAVPGRLDSRGMAVSSCWLEINSSDSKRPFLREHGYREFPVACPRWVTHGDDVYGSSPGMDVLGDVKGMQVLERRKLQAIDKMINPPLRGSSKLVGKTVSMTPGAITADDSVLAHHAVAPLHEVDPAAVREAREEILQHERRIKTGFYADLFLVLENIDKAGMTAREVIERVNERMLQLGPTLETLNDELLDPIIDRTFNTLQRNMLLPEPPEELYGSDLRIEYNGILAQAQKALGTGNLRELLSLAGQIFEVKPDIIDKLDTDAILDEYSVMLGVNPTVVRTDEVVEQVRADRAKQLAQQQALAQAQVEVDGAKTLSETDTEGDNALTRILDSMGAGRSAGVVGSR